MTASLTLFVAGLVLLAFVAGVWVGLAASRRKVRKAETDAMDLLYARHAITEHIRHGREHAARMVG